MLVAAPLLLGGCASLTDSDAKVCPQTYEFGNYGCARLVVTVAPPVEALPLARRFDVRAKWSDEPDGLIAFAPNPGLGAVPLELTLYDHLHVPAVDTATIWVIARVLEVPYPIVTGVPLPVFAADSVLHVARFARVGGAPPVDTIALRLRRRLP